MTSSSANIPAVDGQAPKSAVILRSASVDEGYARWAPTYDQTPNPLLALEQRCLLPLLPNITGKLVLDLACGTGRWLERLLAARPALGIGIDLSLPMLAVGREKASIAGRLVRADCLQLPFSKDRFDLAICSLRWSISETSVLSQLSARACSNSPPISSSQAFTPQPTLRDGGRGFGIGRARCKSMLYPEPLRKSSRYLRRRASAYCRRWNALSASRSVLFSSTEKRSTSSMSHVACPRS